VVDVAAAGRRRMCSWTGRTWTWSSPGGGGCGRRQEEVVIVAGIRWWLSRRHTGCEVEKRERNGGQRREGEGKRKEKSEGQVEEKEKKKVRHLLILKVTAGAPICSCTGGKYFF
jgi:hypothetical protein